MRRSLVNEIGKLDPNFKMGMWDDVDYNMRVRNAGYKTVYLLDTCIYHRGRSTFDIVEKQEGLNVGELLRNNKHYLDHKHFGTPIPINALTNNRQLRNCASIIATKNSWRERADRTNLDNSWL